MDGETTWAMAERHVREGAVRLAGQTALVERMKSGRWGDIPLAERTLELFEITQYLHRQHLRQLEIRRAAAASR